MKGRVRYLVIIVTLALGYLFYEKSIENEKIEYIEKSEHKLQVSEKWVDIVAKSVNESGIKLILDGKKVEIDKDQLYMDDKMNIMISGAKLTEIFGCAVNIYDDISILIEKADIEMKLSLCSSDGEVNGMLLSLNSMPMKKNGELFIPLEAIVDGMGYSYSWDSVSNTGSLIGNKEFLNHLPSYYNYVDKDKAGVVKNQLHLGTCWACASLTALETTLRPEIEMEFSVDHMTLNNSFSLTQYDGGEYSMAMAYLTAWQGPVLEADDPYADRQTDNTLKPMVHVQEIQMIESHDFEEIKRMIYQYGGVESSIYMSLANSESTSRHYNKETNSYCYIGEKKPNHDVVIIGWDDNYPKENFNADLESDGAFICQNSWGSEFGDNGLIYVSYSDSNIGVTNIVYTGVESTDNYDNNYQSDLCGYRGMLGYDRETAYFANVYTAKGNEKLEAAGFYATDKDTEYEVYVCENFENADSLNRRLLVAKGKLKNAGFYTIDFEKDVYVRAGQKFAVIVFVNTPGSTKPVAVEIVRDYASKTVDLTDGEGYISINGQVWNNTEENQECNVCLKCYTVNIDSETEGERK